MDQARDDIQVPDQLADASLGTVADLNDRVKRVIDDTTTGFDYIIGDVTHVNQSNGNLYFDIQDDDNKITCIAFRYNRMALPDFGEEDRVAVSGRLNYYDREASVSLLVESVYLVGESLYHKRIENIATDLEEDGVFDDATKQELPLVPDTVGIITAHGSDAEEDAINSIQSRFPDMDIVVSDVTVQGDGAQEEVLGALAEFERWDRVDVIVVTRGGGSESALLPFSMGGVCRLASNADTPVVSAIGHENDTPLLDRAADARAMTPTDVGETVVINKHEYLDTIDTYRDRIVTGYTRLAETTIDSLRTDTIAAYETHATNTLSTLTRDVTDAYETVLQHRVESLVRDVDSAYQQFVTQEIADLRNTVSRTFDAFEQDVQHERETATLRRREQLYRGVIIALLVLFVLLIGSIVFIVFW